MKNGYEKFFSEKRKNNSGSKRGTQVKVAVSNSTPVSGKRGEKATPEQALKRAFKMKMARKKSAYKKPPFVAIGIVSIGLLVSVAGLLAPDSFDFILNHVEIGFLGRAEAQNQAGAKSAGKDADKPVENSAKLAASNDQTQEKSAGQGSVATTEKPLDVRTWTPEELSIFNKLNERKRELDLREAELTKLEEELQKQKAELDRTIEQLEETRRQIASVLKDRVQTDEEKVSKLVDFYSNMKPQQAAKIFETLNEDLAIEVLDKMKKKNAADIMNILDTKKAQRLSEMLAGYRRSR